jgi:hypothetical protein
MLRLVDEKTDEELDALRLRLARLDTASPTTTEA